MIKVLHQDLFWNSDTKNLEMAYSLPQVWLLLVSILTKQLYSNGFKCGQAWKGFQVGNYITQPL